MTIRRACTALHFDRSTYHYRSRGTDPAFLKKRIKEICETLVRYGYRRVYYILRRDGWAVNMKKVYRLYRELGLQLRNKTPKRRVKAKRREDRAPAIRPNDVWAMDPSTACKAGAQDRLCARPAGDGPQAAHPDCGRHLLPAIAGGRSTVQLSW